jgi:GT2 family glycosyltransferase
VLSRSRGCAPAKFFDVERRRTVVIVVPTYNRRELVVEAVRSVVAQTYADWECLVVDNGSTDGTPEALAALGDDRVQVITTDKPIGGPAARNLGIARAEGAQWVAFLDSDDLWAPDKLERQVAALAAHPEAQWSTTACVDVDGRLAVRHALRLADGPVLDPPVVVYPSGPTRGFLQSDNRVPAGNTTVMAARDVLQQTGGFDPGLATCDDWDLWLRLATRSPLVYVDRPLAAYRIWDGQSSANEHAFIRDAATVRARHFPGTGPLPRAYTARWQREAARRHVAGGRRQQAFVSYLRAAWTGRQPGQLVYAVTGALAPGVAEHRLRSLEKAGLLPEGWAAQVEPWLKPYRPA